MTSKKIVFEDLHYLFACSGDLFSGWNKKLSPSFKLSKTSFNFAKNLRMRYWTLSQLEFILSILLEQGKDSRIFFSYNLFKSKKALIQILQKVKASSLNFTFKWKEAESMLKLFDFISIDMKFYSLIISWFLSPLLFERLRENLSKAKIPSLMFFFQLQILVFC